MIGVLMLDVNARAYPGYLPGDLPGSDVDAVKDVHSGDPENQCGQGWLVVVTGRFVPYLVGHRVGPVAEPSDGLG